MSGATIHLGLMTRHPYEDVDLDTAAGRVRVSDEFVTDEDSFLVWGEQDTDTTLHVVVLLPNLDVDDVNGERVEGLRDDLSRLVDDLDLRLADYAVVTDHDDWSEQQTVYLRDGSVPLVPLPQI